MLSGEVGWAGSPLTERIAGGHDARRVNHWDRFGCRVWGTVSEVGGGSGLALRTGWTRLTKRIVVKQRELDGFVWWKTVARNRLTGWDAGQRGVPASTWIVAFPSRAFLSLDVEQWPRG